MITENDVEKIIYRVLMSGSNQIVPRHTHNRVDSPAISSENILITNKGFSSLVVGSGIRIQTIVSSSATLNFGAILPNSSAGLTMTVVGAVDGSVVTIGVQDKVISTGVNCADISFFAWVSAPDTVTIRCTNTSAVNTANPASGSFISTVILI